MNYQGYIIYRERLRRNWSQAGLCKGICTVSYLSKIETGKAEPSEEVLRLLLTKDIEYYRATPAWLDLTLLSSKTPLDKAIEACMDTRQLAMQRLLQGQENEAVRLTPNA